MNMCPTNLAEGLVASLSPLAASNVFNFDPSSNTWFHGPTRVSSPNGIWMRPNNLKIVIDETEIYDWLCWVSSRTMLVVHPVNIFAHYQFVVCDEPCRHHWLSFARAFPSSVTGHFHDFRSMLLRCGTVCLSASPRQPFYQSREQVSRPIPSQCPPPMAVNCPRIVSSVWILISPLLLSFCCVQAD